MESRRIVLMILCEGHKRDSHKEQMYGLSGRRREWDDLREYH